MPGTSTLPAASARPAAYERPSLRELEVLVALIETGKTTAAAHRLGISQPAVSRAVGHLEDVTGQRLFVRTGGRLHPTAEAAALAEEAAPIFPILDRIVRRDWHGERAPQLRLVAPPTFAHRFLDTAVPAFAAAYPATAISIEVAPSSDVVNAVAGGTADLGLVDRPPRHAGIRTRPFLRTRAHVALPVDDPLASRPRLAPADLADRPVLALTRRFSTRALVERAFEDAGVTLRIAAEIATSAILVRLVEAGMGVGIVNPFPVAAATGPAVAFVPFDPAIAYETTFLLPARRPPEAAMRFIETARALPVPTAFGTELLPDAEGTA